MLCHKVAGQQSAVDAIMVSDGDHIELGMLLDMGQNGSDRLVAVTVRTVHV
jgi:hypothetical protein